MSLVYKSILALMDSALALNLLWDFFCCYFLLHYWAIGKDGHFSNVMLCFTSPDPSISVKKILYFIWLFFVCCCCAFKICPSPLFSSHLLPYLFQGYSFDKLYTQFFHVDSVDKAQIERCLQGAFYFLSPLLHRKVVEKMVAFQRTLNEANYLDPFQSGFWPGYGIEMALVIFWMTSDLGRMGVVYSSLPFLISQ